MSNQYSSPRTTWDRAIDHFAIGAGCWEWTGKKTRPAGNYSPRGYLWSGRPQRTGVLATRVIYSLLIGLIPAGLDLDHLCRNPLCVNPDHLEPVTHQENMARGYWARKTHCPQGHEYSAENTIYRPRWRDRLCRTCTDARKGAQ